MDLLPFGEYQHFYRKNHILNGILQKEIRLELAANTSQSHTDVRTKIVVGMQQFPIREVRGSFLSCGHPLRKDLRNVGYIVDSSAKSYPCEVCGERYTYLSLGHEWQHIAFGSRPDKASAFAHALVRRMLIKKYGKPIATQANCFDPTIQEILRIQNSLDDLRCNSLWEDVYPGSAEGLWRKWRDVIDEAKANGKLDTESLSANVFLVGLGRIPAAKFTDLLQIVPLVRKKSFLDALRLTKVIAERFPEEILKESPPTPNLPPAADDTDPSTPSGNGEPKKEPDRKFQDVAGDTVPFGNDTLPSPSELQEAQDAAQELSPQDVAQYLQDLRDQRGQTSPDMQQVLQTLQNSQNAPSLGSTISDLNQHSQVEYERKKGDYSVPALDAHGEDFAQKLQRAIQHIASRKKLTLEAEGTNLNTEAFLRYSYDREDPAFFSVEQRSMGFVYMLVCDSSGSMAQGGKFGGVLQAEATLRRAFRPYNLIRGRFLWFWGGKVSHVVETEGGTYPQEPHDGTPLFAALKLGLESLYLQEDPTQERVLVLLTDGEPTDISDPITIRRQIEDYRRRGIRVFTILITDSQKPELEKMFGPPTFIRYAPPNAQGVEKAIEDLVFRGFLTHLRRS